MTSTGSLPEDHAVPDRSIGYTKPPGTTAWAPNTDTLPYRGTSAGGGYSTVGDLARFAHALLSHKLLDADSTELLTTGKVKAGPGTSTPTASKTRARPTATAASATAAARRA